MMRLLSCAFLLFLAPSFVSAQMVEDSRSPRHSYIDDDDQRRLADLQFGVSTTSNRSMRLTISATGPGVEPIGGYRGIQGHNRYTAEELDLVLRGLHDARVLTRNEAGDLFNGRILPGEFGRLLERRLLPNGRIDFLHESRVLPLQIHVEAAAYAQQRLHTTVIIDGQPRLSFGYGIDDERVVGLEVQSLGHDGYIAQDEPGAGQRRKWKTAAAREVQPPVEKEAWEPRDLEARWILMSTRLAESPERITEWVAWLTESKQFELLEWLAIYHADAFKSHGVGASLLEADAPQWIRVAAWHRNTSPYLGHSRQQATQMLLEASPGSVEHWLRTHRTSIDNWEPALSQLYPQLQRDEVKEVDSSRYLPPLAPKEIFEPLSSDSELPALSDRLEAAPDVLYEHQVIRAINAVIISGRRSEELKQKLRKLINHPNQRIRIEALLAHSFLLPKNCTDRVDEFLRIIDDERESEAVREAALLAVSYQDHPAITLKVHAIAVDPSHPAWKAAVSRVGDIGQKFSVQILQDVMKEELATDQIKLVGHSLGRLIVRESQASPNSNLLAKAISLSSLADAEDDVHRDQIKDWVIDQCKSAPVKTLTHLRDNYQAQVFLRQENYWHPESGRAWQANYEAMHAKMTKRE